MIKTQADLRNHNIIGRERAALIASTASRFQFEKYDRSSVSNHSKGWPDLGCC